MPQPTIMLEFIEFLALEVTLKSWLVSFHGKKTSHFICTSNHMFKSEVWDKFTEFTFLKILR